MNTFGKYIINEYRNMYEKAAQDAIGSIFPRIKESLLSDNPKNKESIDFSVNQTFPKLVYSIITLLKVIIERRDKPTIVTSAIYNDENDEINGIIKIRLLVPKDFKEHHVDKLETIYYELIDALRHELEHVAQLDRGVDTDNEFQNIIDINQKFASMKSSSGENIIDMEDFNNILKNLNTKDEIEAWASSIYLAAKKKKESFTDTLNKTIYGFFSANNHEQFIEKLNKLKPENMKIVMLQLYNWRKNITNYTRARYPNAII